MLFEYKRHYLIMTSACIVAFFKNMSYTKVSSDFCYVRMIFIVCTFRASNLIGYIKITNVGYIKITNVGYLKEQLYFVKLADRQIIDDRSLAQTYSI